MIENNDCLTAVAVAQPPKKTNLFSFSFETEFFQKIGKLLKI